MKTFKLFILFFAVLLVVSIPILKYVYKIDSIETAVALVQGKQTLNYFYEDFGKKVEPFGDKLGVITKRDGDFIYVKTSKGNIEKVGLYFDGTIQTSTNPLIKPAGQPMTVKTPVPVTIIDNKEIYNVNKFDPLKHGAVVQIHSIGFGGIEITVYSDIIVPKS